MGKIKVKILGVEYTLKGENEDIIRQAVSEVENQYVSISEKYKGESVQTIFTLTALNIAEKLKVSELQNRATEQFLAYELQRMKEYLKQIEE
ncbi:MAG: cell division protein ZapA [Ignavibacteria bacterium]|nr:cell division protein ZapA [Ignavibacteria bacterium]